VCSFFHGFWFIGLMMARKMGQNYLPQEYDCVVHTCTFVKAGVT
jgi:hypothetical protein